MATLLDTDHRCDLCRGWRANWHLCCSSRVRVLPDPLVRSQRSLSGDTRTRSRATFNDAYWRDSSRRLAAVEDWWTSNGLGPFNEDHCLAVAQEFENIPLEELLAILDSTLARARQKPMTLRYFKVALEEGRGAYFKRQDAGAARGGKVPNADLVARIVSRAQGGTL